MPAPLSQLVYFVGTAGWGVPRAVTEAFPPADSNLERYAARFNGVEINSTFYRRHKPSTYARWVGQTPTDFRFAVKLPRTITHQARLIDTESLLAAFGDDVVPLGAKLGPLLVQLPPSLAYDAAVASKFFDGLRALWPGAIVCEPRHTTWFAESAEALMLAYRIGRVAADPARHPAAATPGGWQGIRYWRLHGSPRMYFSAYEEAVLQCLVLEMRSEPTETWCVFDNTASGAAAADALRLQAMLRTAG